MEKFSRENIYDCSYDNYPLKHIELLPGLIVSNPELCGLNVTIPHKTAVLNFIDVVEPAIDEIGAVNVLNSNEQKMRLPFTDLIPMLPV